MKNSFRISFLIRVLLLVVTAQSLAFAAELADSAEVKVTLSTADLTHSMKALKYDRDEAEIRKIYFIDTKKLSLFEQNILLRVRVGSEDNSDVTVKQRPADKDFDWSEYEEEDFKCEADIAKTKKVTSCSLKNDIADEDLEYVVDGDDSIKSLLNKSQKTLLEELEIDINWSQVKLLGPITSTAWDIRHDRKEFSVEVWKLKGGETFLEISRKGDLSDVAEIKKDLAKLVKDLGLQEDTEAISKTEFALKQLAGK